MLDKSSELKLAQVMAATAEMFSSVIRVLEERGLVGQGEFASAFERCADVAEKDVAGSPFPLGFPRYDILMIRQTAKILTRKRKAGGWQPTIIQGGLSEQNATDDESDFRLIVGGHLGAFWLWASGSPSPHAIPFDMARLCLK